MKKYMLAVAVASSALLTLQVQAAPLSAGGSAAGVVQSGVEQVRHCREWSGGWGCGWRGGWGGEGHSRYWSHRRHGSGGYWR